MMPEWVLYTVLDVGFVLLVALVWGSEALGDRRRMRESLGRIVSHPQIVKDLARPAALPEFCPICDRPMSLPVGVAEVVTLSGSKSSIYCCSYCLALGGLDSMLSAAAEQAASPDRTDLAQPCGPLSDARAISDLPGGASPAAGTF